MKRFFRSPFNWLLLLLTGLAFVLWIFQLAANHQILCYRYLYIPHVPLFLVLIFIAMVLPTVLLLAALSWWHSGKRELCLTCLLVFGLMILPSAIAGVGLCFTLYSRTTNPENFAQYDYLVEELLEERPAEWFPEEIPADARDVRYEYSYMMEEELYIAVSWTAEEAHLEQLQTDLAGVEPAWSRDGQTYWKFKDGMYEQGIIVDLSQGNVYYILAHRDATLPDTVQDVFS